MKKIISLLVAAGWYVAIASAALGQDTTPRGPSEWTGRNWLGFCIQISVFILAIIGIYRLAMSGGGEVNDEIRMRNDEGMTKPE